MLVNALTLAAHYTAIATVTNTWKGRIVIDPIAAGFYSFSNQYVREIYRRQVESKNQWLQENLLGVVGGFTLTKLIFLDFYINDVFDLAIKYLLIGIPAHFIESKWLLQEISQT